MDLRIARDILGVIRSERDARRQRLGSLPSDVAYDQWMFIDTRRR